MNTHTDELGGHMLHPPAATRTPAWTGTRVAHPARDLARSTAYYRDLLGLHLLGGFEDHDGYDGIFLALPGAGELELTAGPVAPAAGTGEDLLILYLDTLDEVRAIAAELIAAGVPTVDSPNPYWTPVSCGQRVPRGDRRGVRLRSPRPI